MTDKGINPEYKALLKILTEHVFDLEKVNVKEIAGKQVTGKEMLEYFKSYCKVLQKQQLSEPKALLEATEEARDMIALGKAEDVYKEEMDKVYDLDTHAVNCDILENYHKKSYSIALQSLRSSSSKQGKENIVFEDKLRDKLMKLYSKYKADVEYFGAKVESLSSTAAYVNGTSRVSECKKYR